MSDTTIFTKGLSDGWTLVSSTALNVRIKSNNESGFWRVAVAAEQPDAAFAGEKYVGGEVARIEGLTGSVWVRAETAHTFAVTVGDGVQSVTPVSSTGVAQGSTITLASAVTTVSTQAQVNVAINEKTIECYLTGTGTISATVLVYGAHTNRNTDGTLLGTLSPSGTTTAVDSIEVNTPWPYMWSDTTAISGTSASHNTTIGV